MSRSSYSVGDTVVVRADLTRTASADRKCRIVGILPAAEYGEPQYRIRFGTENFDRRIFEGDIDASETDLPVRQDDAAAMVSGKRWLKPLSTKAAK
ncbi:MULTISPECIES: cold-shock protein [unclassified Sinorhizobium]|uniref:cold-shock protein n=1 Tax=unclassified Sinorhizobium TaxID=2613772 RepID=UPI0024C326E6|nr:MULTISPECIES: cold-shock protein [unclassified Sinorhizobium]MDK1378556.1 cold-shock protein [Sinorhizobium sp. 6-70]MDK1482913.1 cold-shock protein [Sinorhizobium sp. 6-117]